MAIRKTASHKIKTKPAGIPFTHRTTRKRFGTTAPSASGTRPDDQRFRCDVVVQKRSRNAFPLKEVIPRFNPNCALNCESTRALANSSSFAHPNQRHSILGSYIFILLYTNPNQHDFMFHTMMMVV